MITCMATIVAANAQELAKNSSNLMAPAFSWESTSHDFGKIEKGRPVTVVFKFKNTGNAPLLISKANSSCGCTASDYSKNAIVPGESGFVKVNYNAASLGTFSKTVTVYSNLGDIPVELSIKGEVVEMK